MEKQYTAPTLCSVCGQRLTITQLTCENCKTRVEGNFNPGSFGRLNDDQRRFVEIFLVNRGNLREAGKTLNLSYPTMRLRLDEIIQIMGLTPAKPEAQEVLERLQKGELSMEEALAHFKEE